MKALAIKERERERERKEREKERKNVIYRKSIIYSVCAIE